MGGSTQSPNARISLNLLCKSVRGLTSKYLLVLVLANPLSIVNFGTIYSGSISNKSYVSYIN